MKRFYVAIEQLSDGSMYATVYGKRPLIKKKLGTFSGSLDGVMVKARQCINAKLDEMSQKALQEIEE